ncbi:MAG: GDSL family lipase [Deltaproteobacteria bacterium]|nr:GDSL family lipase [Deltaproteobacteria bacterium]
MKRFVFILIAIACLYFAVNSVRLVLRIYKGRELAETSTAFEVKNPLAVKRVLIIGDSTGVGTGADDPADTIAGLIAREFPSVEIINKSMDGAKASNIPMQLDSLEDAGFDLVLLQVGGNDILKFTDPDMLKNSVAEIMRLASKFAPEIIFMSTGNVGSAPAFFPPLNWIYTERTRTVRSVFMLISREKGIEYVDLFREKSEDPFLTDPEQYFAADLLHPGSRGYALWYEELRNQSSLVEILSSHQTLQENQ